MGKLDELRRTASGNADESMGVGRAPIHGVSPAAPRPVPGRMQGLVRSRDAAEIAVDRIAPDPAQPREDFDPEALERLADSLRTRGQLQPIRVRWDDATDRYVLIMGERRWRAARMAGLASLSCVIADAPASEGELLALQLIENALREDLRPIEQARAFRTLMDCNGWSARELARELAIAQPNVVRALALLDLPEAVREQVERGTLAPSVAYEVSKLDDPDAQRAMAERVVAEGLTRDGAAEAVRTATTRSGRKVAAGKGRGAGKARSRRPIVRSVRTSLGKVTVELKKGLGADSVPAALREATRTVEGGPVGDQAAA